MQWSEILAECGVPAAISDKLKELGFASSAQFACSFEDTAVLEGFLKTEIVEKTLVEGLCVANLVWHPAASSLRALRAACLAKQHSAPAASPAGSASDVLSGLRKIEEEFRDKQEAKSSQTLKVTEDKRTKLEEAYNSKFTGAQISSRRRAPGCKLLGKLLYQKQPDTGFKWLPWSERTSVAQEDDGEPLLPKDDAINGMGAHKAELLLSLTATAYAEAGCCHRAPLQAMFDAIMEKFWRELPDDSWRRPSIVELMAVERLCLTEAFRLVSAGKGTLDAALEHVRLTGHGLSELAPRLKVKAAPAPDQRLTKRKFDDQQPVQRKRPRDRSPLPRGGSQEKCRLFATTGRCKYGAGCKFKH